MNKVRRGRRLGGAATAGRGAGRGAGCRAKTPTLCLLAALPPLCLYRLCAPSSLCFFRCACLGALERRLILGSPPSLARRTADVLRPNRATWRHDHKRQGRQRHRRLLGTSFKETVALWRAPTVERQGGAAARGGGGSSTCPAATTPRRCSQLTSCGSADRLFSHNSRVRVRGQFWTLLFR